MPYDDNLYLAAMGYTAYTHALSYRTAQGAFLPTWDQLPEAQQTAWVNAAAAVRRRVVDNGMTAEQSEEPTP